MEIGTDEEADYTLPDPLLPKVSLFRYTSLFPPVLKKSEKKSNLKPKFCIFLAPVRMWLRKASTKLKLLSRLWNAFRIKGIFMENKEQKTDTGLGGGVLSVVGMMLLTVIGGLGKFFKGGGDDLLRSTRKAIVSSGDDFASASSRRFSNYGDFANSGSPRNKSNNSTSPFTPSSIPKTRAFTKVTSVGGRSLELAKRINLLGARIPAKVFIRLTQNWHDLENRRQDAEARLYNCSVDEAISIERELDSIQMQQIQLEQTIASLERQYG